MTKVIILVGIALFFASATICMPSLLGANKFLESFVGHEILGLMAIILTVTLASVANIHLSLNRIILNKFPNNSKLREAATNVKKELSDNAWYIFWGFSAVGLALIVKGASDNVYVHSSVNGAATWALILFIFCMHDIYSVVFGMARLELDLGLPTKPPSTHDAPDGT